MTTAQMPILYIPHGGGPMPLLGEPNHAGLVGFLQSMPSKFVRPKAILMISAHWEGAIASVSSASEPAMIYDYSGFPQEAYALRYPAPGSPELARQVIEMLNKQGLEAMMDPERGFDHGTFVPLMLMYPQADIPVVQLSLTGDMDPAGHIRMGVAIAELSQRGVLILGSGMSFHNMGGFMSSSRDAYDKSAIFDRWLNEVVVADQRPGQARQQHMLDWALAPGARFCHPREEHLLPLHVCFGAAERLGLAAENVFDGDLLGVKVSAFIWDSSNP